MALWSSRLLPSVIALVFLAQAFGAQVPSYIKVCGRRDPEITKCVIDSVNKLRPKLRSGIPELHVPSLEPLHVPEVPLAVLNNFKAIAKDVHISGISDFNLTYLKLDFDKQRIDLEVTISKVVMEADYDVIAKILVDIHEKGPITTISHDVYARISLKFDKVPHRGQIHLYFTNIVMKLVLKDYEAKFKPRKNSAVTEAINAVLVESKEEIIGSMTPNLEKAISTKILEVANKICKNFTYEDLFPDRV